MQQFLRLNATVEIIADMTSYMRTVSRYMLYICYTDNESIYITWNDLQTSLKVTGSVIFR